MIGALPELRIFNVEIARHRLAHRPLRELCAALYGCRGTLGDFASSDDWRRFARPVWAFHNIATAAPLPLSHSALLAVAQRPAIEEAAQRLRHIEANAHQVAERILALLYECLSSDDNPLGEALANLVSASTSGAVFVPYDDQTVLSAVRNSDCCPTSCQLLSPNQEKERREHFRRGESVIVLGKLASIESAHLRAPRADIHLDVLLYEWVGDKTARELASPLLSELAGEWAAPKGNEALRFSETTVTNRGTGNDADSSPGAPDVKLAETRPFTLPSPDLLELLAAHRTPQGDPATPVLAISVVLAGEGQRLMILAEPDEPVTILRHVRAELSATEIRAADLVAGDFLVDRTGTSDHNLIEQIADELLAQDRDSLLTLQKRWKDLLIGQVARLGIPEVTKRIAEHCEGWRPGPERIVEWTRSDTIGPQQKQAFRAACRFLGISEGGAKEHWRAMRAIQSARIAAGKELSQRALDHIIDQSRKQNLHLDAPTVITFADRTSTVYPVRFLVPRLRLVPRSALGVVFRPATDEGVTSWHE